MAKKQKAPKAPSNGGLLDKLTTLILVLFFCSLAFAHVVSP